jgi:cytochrome c5
MTTLSRTLRVVLVTAAALLSATAPLLSQATPAKPVPPKNAAPAKRIPATHSDPAERAFQANCNRCHYAPETLSPRITGTVVRHMRIRANLSAEDERLILSYLNP